MKINELTIFLQQVLTQDYKFEMPDFEDKVLNFTLKVIVSEIFFSLKTEREFFKRDDMPESINLLIQFC